MSRRLIIIYRAIFRFAQTSHNGGKGEGIIPEQTVSDVSLAYFVGKIGTDVVNTAPMVKKVSEAEKKLAESQTKNSLTRILNDKNWVKETRGKLETATTKNAPTKIINKTAENVGQEISNRARTGVSLIPKTKIKVKQDNLNTNRANYIRSYEHLRRK